MINWKAKLSSRKFWAMLAGFITPILIMCNVEESTITTIVSIITSCGTLIAYIVAEGAVDLAREENAFIKGVCEEEISEEDIDG